MAQSKILDSNINTRSQVGRQVINEKNATSFMKKYELFDRVDLFPKEIRTMEIKDWESFARRNPYLAKFLNKKLPGYFFLALETWNSADDSASSSPLVETIFEDTIIYWRNLILDNDEKMSAEASILLKNIGLALASVPGDNK
ncbi:hypothetical protein HN460_03520 [bacterium]|mgnify:FL=1|jgi:hypothetical protein|nr:hypothetical protein [bacterium]MBT3795289.1 hypothetical protein [bacterium]